MLDYGQLKPQRAVGEVSAFPGDRVKELFDVVTSATELPSFEEVLKVHCGGSLEQICSFYANQVKIEAEIGLQGNRPFERCGSCLSEAFSSVLDFLQCNGRAASNPLWRK